MKDIKRAGTFVGVGVILTVIDYLVCELLVLLFFKSAGDTSIASVISGGVSTIAAFFMHSRITWKDRKITKINIVKFFVWNVVVFMMLRPLVLAGLNYLIELVATEFNWNGVVYDFIASTGAFGLVTIITMILNYLFYDKFVFKKEKKHGK